MIFYTGDIHGSKKEVVDFCQRYEPTTNDTIVLLGDVGANFYGAGRDKYLKKALSGLGPTIFCIQGNHEMRPATSPSYTTKRWNGGQVWYEED